MKRVEVEVLHEDEDLQAEQHMFAVAEPQQHPTLVRRLPIQQPIF